jgi:hypothetical protein
MIPIHDPFGPSHVAEPPSWDCVVCLQPWPCANAKSLLISEFYGFPAVLAVHMSARMSEALIDLTADGAEAPPDLRDRFLAWVQAAAASPRSGNNSPAAKARHLHQRPANAPR